MICRKATVVLSDANFLSPWCQSPSFRAQNRGFCALLGLGTFVFGHFEHKIGVFVRFWGWEPLFSGISSTKSGFLCAFGVGNPCFLAFRAQNRGFCAFLAFGTLVFRLFEHKIEVFVLFWPSEPSFSGFSSTKSRFLCAFGVGNPRFQAFRAQNRGFCALIIMKWPSGRGKRPLCNGNLWLGGGIGK